MNLDFNKNLGNTDKIIRAIIGTILFIVGFFLKGWLKVATFIGAALSFFDVIFSYCIGYDMFDFSTRE